MIKISVIVPNYNNAKWLSKCLDSCLAQKGQFELEVIVVDDASTDESWEIINTYQSKYPTVFRGYKNVSKGGNQARNYGFSKCTGNYIQWLDSDDLLIAGKLQAQAKFLMDHPEYDIAYSDWKMVYYEGDKLLKSELKKSQHYDDYLMQLVLDNWHPPISYLLRREAAQKLDKMKAWHPKRKVAQDREYFNKAAIHGMRFAYVEGVFSIYNRWSKKTVSKIDFKKRATYNLELEKELINEINKRVEIPNQLKRNYISILKTDALKACFYFPSLTIKQKISFFDINWSRVHYKMRPLIPFIWVFQNIKLLLSARNAS